MSEGHGVWGLLVIRGDDDTVLRAVPHADRLMIRFARSGETRVFHLLNLPVSLYLMFLSLSIPNRTLVKAVCFTFKPRLKTFDVRLGTPP